MHVSRRSGSAASAAARIGATAQPRDAGFSLVEVLVSLTIFMGVAGASGMAVLGSAHYAEANDNRVVAAGLATAQMEQIMAAANPDDLTAGNTTIVRNGTTFSVKRFVFPATECTATLTRVVTVRVAWPGSGDASLADTSGAVYLDSVRAC